MQKEALREQQACWFLISVAVLDGKMLYSPYSHHHHQLPGSGEVHCFTDGKADRELQVRNNGFC